MINILSAWFYIEKSQYVIGEHTDLVIRIKRGGCQQNTAKVGEDVNIYVTHQFLCATKNSRTHYCQKMHGDILMLLKLHFCVYVKFNINCNKFASI